MQLMASVGVEYGEHKGLDWIKGKVVRLAPADPALRIPQMGWNNLRPRRVIRLLRRHSRGDACLFRPLLSFRRRAAADVLATVAITAGL